MSIGICKILRALLFSVLLSAVCLLVLSAFAITRDAPETLVTGCGRATLFFCTLFAGFLGAKSNGGFLGGMLTATLLLVPVLLCAPLFSTDAAPAEKWILLAVALACGILGSYVGGRRRTKVVRRKKRAHRG